MSMGASLLHNRCGLDMGILSRCHVWFWILDAGTSQKTLLLAGFIMGTHIKLKTDNPPDNVCADDQQLLLNLNKSLDT